MWYIRHKSLVIAVLIAAMSFAMIFIAIIPIYQSANKMLSKIKTKSSELESMTSKVTLLSKLDPNVLDERVAVLDSALPSRKDVLLYLNSINGLSQELGLTFGGLSLTPGDIKEATRSAVGRTTAPGVQYLATDIKMGGNKENIYTFLRTIEELLPLMQIDNIKVSVLGPDQYALNLTLAMLWAPTATFDVKGAVTLFGEEEDKYFSQLSQYRRFDVALPVVESNPAGKSDLFAQSAILLPSPLPTITPTTSEITPQQ